MKIKGNEDPERGDPIYIIGNGVIGKVLAEDMLLLSASIQKSIQAMIVDKMLDQLKLNYILWTRKAVKEPVALSPSYIFNSLLFASNQK